jgi:BirA family transcriptional regulator, biotin operon repressor / biotin---[acetyl-CoA-carboxylase] ligase
VSRLGTPHLHLRETTSTNDRARALAIAGAPHGALVTAAAQTAGRGRQGRTWSAPPGRALLMSLVLRAPDRMLPLAAAVAVAEAAGEHASIKWPNDVLLDGRKVAGVLVEARPQENWAVLGIGVNAALDVTGLPAELRETAGTLGRTDLDVALSELLEHLDLRLTEPSEATLHALSDRDALFGRPLTWAGGEGTGAGIDARGGLRVKPADGGETTVLDAGEVHLR